MSYRKSHFLCTNRLLYQCCCCMPISVRAKDSPGRLKNIPSEFRPSWHSSLNILGILDHCADTESYRIVQVQLSRIVLYHLKEKGFDRETLRTEHLDQEKMEYLYTGKEGGKSHNYGLNFSDIDFLREFTGLSYQVMFTGVE